MPFNEELTNRVRDLLQDIKKVKEKKMFAGIAFMVNEKLCIAVRSDSIMLRINPVLHDNLVEKEGCSSMIMRGKELKGYVVVDEAVLNTKKKLNYWVQLALDYNPEAKTAKMKTLSAKNKS